MMFLIKDQLNNLYVNQMRKICVEENNLTLFQDVLNSQECLRTDVKVAFQQALHIIYQGLEF